MQYSANQPSPQHFVPYAVPVDTALMASSSNYEYLRPQTWRNLPQQQNRANNATGYSLIHAMDQPAQQTGHFSSNISTVSHEDSLPSLTNSDVAMAANASVAATVAGQGAICMNESDESLPVASRSSVDTAVETMWEARRAREKAEEEADQKLLDAVCKASLVEYNARENVLKSYDCETSQRSVEHQTSSVALQQAKCNAKQRKRAAMQTVIDSKTFAQQMSEKAREATLLYEQKNNERLAKRAELDVLKLREAQEAEMMLVQKRKEEAMRKRTDAEQKARKAREKAEFMRCQAFQAASKVRAHSRLQIETQLGEEEAQRRRELQRKLDEIEKNKEIAHQRKEAAAKKAEDARRRADKLRLKAEQARAGLKLLSTNTASTFST